MSLTTSWPLWKPSAGQYRRRDLSWRTPISRSAQVRPRSAAAIARVHSRIESLRCKRRAAVPT